MQVVRMPGGELTESRGNWRAHCDVMDTIKINIHLYQRSQPNWERKTEKLSSRNTARLGGIHMD